MENKSFKENLRDYRLLGLTVLQWMALLALLGLILNISISLFF